MPYVIFYYIDSETDHTPPGSVKKGKRSSGGTMRSDDNETIKALCEGLGASDWMSRLQAIERLQEMCETHDEMVTANIVKVSIVANATVGHTFT